MRLPLLGLVLLLVVPGLRLPLITPPPGKVTLPSLTPEAVTRRYRVAVVTWWGYHAAVLVEQPAAWRLGPPGKEDYPLVEYGWGERRFYYRQERTYPAMFAAAFLGTPSTGFLDAWNALPGASEGARPVFQRTVTAEQLRSLVTALEETFPRNPDGSRAAPLPPYLEKRGRFYPGRESYIWWSDCNAWTVRCLERAGLARTSAGVIFVHQVPDRLLGFQQ